MEKNITWENITQNLTTWQLETDTFKQTGMKMVSYLSAPVEWLRKYYSGIFEKEITMRRTLQLINAQLAFICAAFPVESPIWLRLVCCAWLIHALRCAKGI